MRVYLILETSDAYQPEFLHQQRISYQVIALKWSDSAARHSSLEERTWALVEIQLSLMDGMAFIKAVGTAQPRVGIVVTQAGGGVAECVQGYEAGADIFMNQPVSDMELDAMAQAMVRRLARMPLSETSRYARRP